MGYCRGKSGFCRLAEIAGMASNKKRLLLLREIGFSTLDFEDLVGDSE